MNAKYHVYILSEEGATRTRKTLSEGEKLALADGLKITCLDGKCFGEFSKQPKISHPRTGERTFKSSESFERVPLYHADIISFGDDYYVEIRSIEAMLTREDSCVRMSMLLEGCRPIRSTVHEMGSATFRTQRKRIRPQSELSPACAKRLDFSMALSPPPVKRLRETAIVCVSKYTIPPKLRQELEQIADGRIVNAFNDQVTHLVMPSIIRTSKFMCALASPRCQHIVAPTWLHACAQQGTFSVSTQEHEIHDTDSEHKFAFSLASVLRSRIRDCVFRGLNFLLVSLPVVQQEAEKVTSYSKWNSPVRGRRRRACARTQTAALLAQLINKSGGTVHFLDAADLHPSEIQKATQRADDALAKLPVSSLFIVADAELDTEDARASEVCLHLVRKQGPQGALYKTEAVLRALMQQRSNFGADWLLLHASEVTDPEPPSVTATNTLSPPSHSPEPADLSTKILGKAFN